MRLLSVILIIFVSNLSAFCVDAEANLGLGYRHDELDWRISGPGNEPNILSELEWKELLSCEVSGSLQFCINSYLLKASGDYASIFDGNNTDSDYFGNNRTELFSRSKSKAGKGDLYDLSLSFGQQMKYGCFTLTPLVGWSWNYQNLNMYSGRQTEDPENPSHEGARIPGLKSSYKAKWEGPWVGLDATFQPISWLQMKGCLEYHWGYYRGTGHWNLRPELYRDFVHKADSQGIIVSLSGEYGLTDCLLVGLEGVYRQFRTQKGNEDLYIFIDLEEEGVFLPYHLVIPFRGTDWNSYTVRLYLSYAF